MTAPAPAAAPAHVASTRPGAVTAAAVTTIVAATISGGLTLVTAVFAAVIGRAVLQFFDDTGSLVAWFLGVAVTVLALSSVAVVASVGLLRRRRWAWWALLALTPVTVVAGAVAGRFLLPLGVAAAATAVFVLLLLPSTRGWLAASSA
ncbi:hypothetical protein GCM10009798_39380 [Nocardioides panacihumi]|uniref:Uncharacterized protein n=1 Tax=Nocardioides panacihumi TaxID=400774 RepID=A0ABN2RSR1_9ACTN